MQECLKLSGGHSEKQKKAIIRGTDPYPGRVELHERYGSVGGSALADDASRTRSFQQNGLGQTPCCDDRLLPEFIRCKGLCGEQRTSGERGLKTLGIKKPRIVAV